MDIDRELRLEPYRGAARAARRFVETAVRDWHIGIRAREIILVCHELVANAVLHARTSVRLRLSRRPGAILIEVTDADPHPPCRGMLDDPMATSGRGIMIVERLALHWGVRELPAGKVVWAELADGQTGWAELAEGVARQAITAAPSRQPHPV